MLIVWSYDVWLVDFFFFFVGVFFGVMGNIVVVMISVIVVECMMGNVMFVGVLVVVFVFGIVVGLSLWSVMLV